MRDWTRQFSPDLWFAPGEDGEEDAAFLFGALGIRPGARVLDAPCGAGRVALPLAQAGCRVTGVDLEPSFIVRAERRFREAHLDGLFVLVDLRRMDFREAFDAAYCWGSSFGYFSDEDNAGLSSPGESNPDLDVGRAGECRIELARRVESGTGRWPGGECRIELARRGRIRIQRGGREALGGPNRPAAAP